MKRLRTTLALIGLLPMVTLGLPACEREGPAEDLGEEIDDLGDDIGDSAEDAADEIEDAADDLGD